MKPQILKEISPRTNAATLTHHLKVWQLKQRWTGHSSEVLLPVNANADKWKVTNDSTYAMQDGWQLSMPPHQPQSNDESDGDDDGMNDDCDDGDKDNKDVEPFYQVMSLIEDENRHLKTNLGGFSTTDFEMIFFTLSPVLINCSGALTVKL